MTRSAAVTVRRPGARTVPATRTRTWRQFAGVKADAKGCIHAASTLGTLVGMAQTSAWGIAPGEQPLRAEVVTMAGADAMRERIAAHPWPPAAALRSSEQTAAIRSTAGARVVRLRACGRPARRTPFRSCGG